jgi:predicted SAM-dependent methyltransferase
MSQLWLNCGSCDLPLTKPWLNLDISDSPHIQKDLQMDCRKLDEHFNEGTVDRIYAGHFVEHLTPTEAEEWVAMCYRLLKPGGDLGFTTPDFDYIARDYIAGNITLERMNNLYIHSYDQESHHMSQWNYAAQAELCRKVGFSEVSELDRMNDERLAFGVPWQVGCNAIK